MPGKKLPKKKNTNRFIQVMSPLSHILLRMLGWYDKFALKQISQDYLQEQDQIFYKVLLETQLQQPMEMENEEKKATPNYRSIFFSGRGQRLSPFFCPNLAKCRIYERRLRLFQVGEIDKITPPKSLQEEKGELEDKRAVTTSLDDLYEWQGDDYFLLLEGYNSPVQPRPNLLEFVRLHSSQCQRTLDHCYEKIIKVHYGKTQSSEDTQPQERTMFHWAVACRQSSLKLDSLLESGSDINAATKSGVTALIIAVRYGDLDSVNYLINSGANIRHVARKNGVTALMIAAKHGYFEIVKCLVEKTKELKSTDSPSLAQTGDLVKITINAETVGYGSVLMIAARHGHLQIVNYLIDEGANVEARRVSGFTALMDAAEEGHIEVVRSLIQAIKKAEVDEKKRKQRIEGYISIRNSDYSGFGMSALMLAARRGFLEIVRYLTEEMKSVVEMATLSPKEFIKKVINPDGGDSDPSALIFAIKQGHFDIVRHIIEEIRNVLGANLLEAIYSEMDSYGGQQAAWLYAVKCYEERIRLLLFLDGLVENGFIAIVKYLADIEISFVSAVDTSLDAPIEYLVARCGEEVNEPVSFSIHRATMGYLTSLPVFLLRYLYLSSSPDSNCSELDSKTIASIMPETFTPIGKQDVLIQLYEYFQQGKENGPGILSSEKLVIRALYSLNTGQLPNRVQQMKEFLNTLSSEQYCLCHFGVKFVGILKSIKATLEAASVASNQEEKSIVANGPPVSLSAPLATATLIPTPTPSRSRWCSLFSYCCTNDSAIDSSSQQNSLQSRR